MNGQDASQDVPGLLDTFIALQVQGSDSVNAKARLKRIAFTLLLGLDKNEKVIRWQDPHQYASHHPLRTGSEAELQP